MSIFKKPVKSNSVFPNNTFLGDNPARLGTTTTVITEQDGVSGTLETVYFSKNFIMLRLVLSGVATTGWSRTVGIATPYGVADFNFQGSKGFIAPIYADVAGDLGDKVGFIRKVDDTGDVVISIEDGATFTEAFPQQYFLWLIENPGE